MFLYVFEELLLTKTTVVFFFLNFGHKSFLMQLNKKI